MKLYIFSDHPHTHTHFGSKPLDPRRPLGTVCKDGDVLVVVSKDAIVAFEAAQAATAAAREASEAAKAGEVRQ